MFPSHDGRMLTRSWMVLTRRRRDDIQGASPQQLQSLVEDLLNPMTIMYMLVQEALEHPVALASVRAKLRKLPSLLWIPSYFVSFLACVTLNFLQWRCNQTWSISCSMLPSN